MPLSSRMKRGKVNELIYTSTSLQGDFGQIQRIYPKSLLYSIPCYRLRLSGMATESSGSSTKNEFAWSPKGSLEPPTDPAKKPLVAIVSGQITDTRGEEEDALVRRSGYLRWSSFIWESLALILSTGFLIAIVAILAHYNHQPQPDWDRVSLNSVISWLSALSKACVIVCISESLGQLKWVWFAQKRRPISDLQYFDSASRGTWGSLQLIWSLRAR